MLDVMALNKGLNLVGILDAAHRIDAFFVLGKGRHDGARAGGNHQLVVANRLDLGIRRVDGDHLHTLGGAIQAHRFSAI